MLTGNISRDRSRFIWKGVPWRVTAKFMADGLVLSAHDLVLAILLGTLQVGMGFSLITLGARWVPAAQVALR